MIDVYHNSESDLGTQVFYADSASWQTWVKPRNCRFISMLVFGGGGGGGGGNTGADGTSRGGGGGGGSSGISRGFFSSEQLPDILFVQVGVGGTGGAANNGGATGGLSTISIRPDTISGNVIMRSGAAGGVGGSAGSAIGGGGGIAGTIFAAINGLINFIGQCVFSAGQAGNGGGTQGIGLSIVLQYPVSSGAGGGGTNTTTAFAGGSITGAELVIPVIAGGAAGATTIADHGYTGTIPSLRNSVRVPPIFTGGGGGGASTNSTGGNGGNGSYGSGGGGGGAGTTGGRGGDGGNGLVIITAL